MKTKMRTELQLGLWLGAIGIIAIFSLLLAPLEMLQPQSIQMSPLAFRSLALINPLILTILAIAIGGYLAPSVGLDAPLVRAMIVGKGPCLVLRQQILPALIVGLASAAVLYGYGIISSPWFAAAKLPEVPMPIATKLLYGGVVEEIMIRWGVMTLFVWGAWRIAGRPETVKPYLYIAGAFLAALVFAVGHLPLLFAVMPSPPAGLIAAVILGNTLPGILFGVLFWRRGLESAMIAHASAHLFFTLGSII